jgi:P-type E1-E2 ATPase
MFLFFSTSLWFYEEYYIYSVIILVTCLLAIGITVYQLLSLNQKIYNMAYYEIPINTLRNGHIIKVSSIDLVPGDIVFLKEPIKLPFEGVILEGSALINECALTGESVPVVKKADVLEHYQKQRSIDKAASVFEGTTIIQVNCKQ